MARSEAYKRLIQTRRWRSLRLLMLAKHPWCMDCDEQGRHVFATEVHHIRPIESGKTLADMRALAYDEANLVALCRDCHTARHTRLGSHDSRLMRQREIDRALRMFDDDPL